MFQIWSRLLQKKRNNNPYLSINNMTRINEKDTFENKLLCLSARYKKIYDILIRFNLLKLDTP